MAQQMDTQSPVEQPDEQSEPSGYTICIKVGADGSLSVGTESDAMESQEAAAGIDDEQGFKSAENIKDALTIALDIYKSNGEMSEGQADDDFAQGFGMASKPKM